jgi:Ribonuclease H2 non-catalytic subunit (Ylr154p-like)
MFMSCHVISPTLVHQKSLNSSKCDRIPKHILRLPSEAANYVVTRSPFPRIMQVHTAHICSDKGHVYRPRDNAARMDAVKYGDEDEDEDDEEEEGEKVEWETREKFTSVTVWEHHSLPDAKQEHWIRGIEEWITMAETVGSLFVRDGC